MTMKDVNSTTTELLAKLRALIDADQHPLTDVARDRVAVASVPGVYAISTKEGGEILYIGRNTTATVAKRAWQHINTPTPSDLKGMLRLHPDLPANTADYAIRWIRIDEDRERHFFEAFAIGVLQPKMNFKTTAQPSARPYVSPAAGSPSGQP